MVKSLLKPDYIFESSWEVCNKVGGIYTVLSTRAKTLQKAHQDKVIFIGPGLWKREDGNYTKEESPYFREDPSLFAEWQREARENGLQVRVGRWTVPGEPIAILVDFVPYFEKKSEITVGCGRSIRSTHYMPMVIMMRPRCSRMLPH